MSFLQPWLLVALPVAALPVIIHLINQRRFHTIDWAAMRFLLEANRMSRGYARIRQWLILLFRVLAIAGLIFMISRPLASGWLGLTGGGRADTTIVLIDRSPSMQQVGQGTASSKIETGVAQLVQTLNTLGSTRWVLIDSHTAEPREIDSPDSILRSPSAEAASATSALPAMLQAAHDYIKNNRTGETEVWICSDLRANDWNAQSGRWKSLRDSFQEFKQSVRFHLLAYSSPAPEDIAVRVTGVERRTTGDGAVLLISLKLTREANWGVEDSAPGTQSNARGKLRLPVRFEIEGATSELPVEFEGREFELKDHHIPLAGDHPKGWGRISIPSDLNPADNEYYFVFDDPPPRRTILVAEGDEEVRPLELAAGIAADPTVKCEVETVAARQLASVRWEGVALLLWQAPLPSGDAADMIKQFVDRGGRVVFFPPKLPNNDAIFDGRWTRWVEPPEPLRIETWWGDADLLARTQSGAAVPVGELIIRRYCGLEGEFTPLATLPEKAPLLTRVTTDRGGVYFCATTSSMDDASLGTDGVALYVMIQRALAAGAAELGNSLQLNAGDRFPTTADAWTKLAGSEDVLSNEYSYHAGVYAAGERTLAVNRAAQEDDAPILNDAQVAGLFSGLDFARVDDQAGNVTSLTREVWRLFLGAMLVAIVAEAGLCIPRIARKTGETQ
ncbi:MAG: BatA domain-containing protein [Planctomycetes bacterium]|nr:BatA domain-containing protein [Planctomycetota bacterium]